jgi:hypothetical protein
MHSHVGLGRREGVRQTMRSRSICLEVWREGGREGGTSPAKGKKTTTKKQANVCPFPAQ